MTFDLAHRGPRGVLTCFFVANKISFNQFQRERG